MIHHKGRRSVGNQVVRQKVLHRLTPPKLNPHNLRAIPTSRLGQLDSSNYTAYVLVQLFDCYYLPWLKECVPARYNDEFKSRVDHLAMCLEEVFPQFPRYKARIYSTAKQNCFYVKRKLKLTVDEVKDLLATKKNDNERLLQVRFLLHHSNTGVEELYNGSDLVPMYQGSSMCYDIPITMNASEAAITIQVLLCNSHDEPQDSYNGYTVLVNVNEYDISGFTGYTTRFTVNHTETGEKQSEVAVNFTWELDWPSAIEHVIKRPDLVIEHFSAAFLSMGTYFWRFYSGLYCALLENELSQQKAVKCINEVAFMIGPAQKTHLYLPILKLLKCTDIHSKCYPECSQNVCEYYFHLIHGVCLILDTIDVNEQLELLRQVQRNDQLWHLLRFKCKVMSPNRMLAIHRLLHKRCVFSLKKWSSHWNRQHTTDCLEQMLLEFIIDIFKRDDVKSYLVKEELNQLQDQWSWLLAKLYLLGQQNNSNLDTERKQHDHVNTVIGENVSHINESFLPTNNATCIGKDDKSLSIVFNLFLNMFDTIDFEIDMNFFSDKICNILHTEGMMDDSYQCKHIAKFLRKICQKINQFKIEDQEASH